MNKSWPIFTLLAGTLSLGTFVYAASTGTSFGSPTQRFVPKDVRSNPTGYRTFHYWHSGSGGYRGGK